MANISLNGTRLHYEDTGPAARGEAIVFSHGLLWSTRLFGRQIADLQDRWRCVAYDHRGQGQSAESDLGSISMDLLYEDAVALIEALDLGPVHFCGFSMGGFVGLRLAARRPDLVRSLILLDTAARAEHPFRVPFYKSMNYVSRWLGHEIVMDQVMRLTFGRHVRSDPCRAAECQAWREQLVSNRQTIWRAVNGVIDRTSVEDELTAISAPTLVVVGDEDKTTPAADAERMCDLISDTRLVRIANAGHAALLERPGVVNGAIATFLQSVGEPASMPRPPQDVLLVSGIRPRQYRKPSSLSNA